MLNAVLREINNYFKDCDSLSFTKDVVFTADDTLTGDFTDTFFAGEYILIEGTRLNNSVYLIASVNDTTITIDTTVDRLIKTEPSVSATITKCSIPDDLIDTVAKMKAYNANVTTGISSESQGNRSVSYGNYNGWVSAFNSLLSTYRKLRW